MKFILPKMIDDNEGLCEQGEKDGWIEKTGLIEGFHI